MSIYANEKGINSTEKLFSNQDLKKMLIPLIIEQILVMLVGIADTIMVSYAGEAAISGVALVDMINYLVSTVFAAIATGGAVVVSQYLGNKESDNAKCAASQLLMISLLIALVVTIFCLAFHNGILKILFGSVESDVMQASIIYFVITTMSFPFLSIYNSCAALFRSMQKTNVTMNVSIIMNGINLVGNAIGIFVMKAGVSGVAVPTLIARMVAALLMLVLSLQGKNQVSVSFQNIFSWNKNMVTRILRVAVPNGIENGMFALGKVIVVSIIALFGTSQIAANGVANSIDQVAVIVVNAVNLAIVTVVGQCVGAKEYDQAEYYTNKLMKISWIATGAFSLLVIVGLPVIHGFYDLTYETWRLACILIIMHNIMATMLHPFSFNLSNMIRATGDVKYTLYVGILSMLVFRLGSAWLFGVMLNLEVVGVWIAMGMDWLVRSVAFWARYKSGKWRNYRVI